MLGLPCYVEVVTMTGTSVELDQIDAMAAQIF
jgi:hypothetical protein